LTRLKKEALRTKADRLQDALREAERMNDTASVLALISERIGVIKEIERVGAE